MVLYKWVVSASIDSCVCIARQVHKPPQMFNCSAHEWGGGHWMQKRVVYWMNLCVVVYLLDARMCFGVLDARMCARLCIKDARVCASMCYGVQCTGCENVLWSSGCENVL